MNWPEQLLSHPAAKEEWNEQGARIFRGLRLRIGMHFGEPHCEQDNITMHVEYYGPVVNEAASIAAYAHGGQVLMSSDLYQRLSQGTTKLEEQCLVDPLGSCHLKGIKNHLALYQVSVISLLCMLPF